MHKVEIIYHQGCPNVERARGVVRSALARIGVEARWQEWDRDSPSTPEHLRGYGSPTVLVDGIDVAGGPASSNGSSCRLYDDGNGGLTGVPPVELVMRAMTNA